MLSHGEARPIVVSASSSPTVARGRTPPVDFCNRINPRARPSNRSNPAHREDSRPSAQLWVAGGYAGPRRRTPFEATPGARPTETSRVRGPTRGLRLCGTPPIAIAHDGSFAPTRSARTPLCRKPVTSPAGGADAAGHSAFGGAPLRARRRARLYASPGLRAASRAPPRRRARSAITRGAFHSRISPWRSWAPPQTVPSL
jgi:hypothetical protein